MPEPNDIETQEEVAHRLLNPRSSITWDEAMAIAAEVYQPLLDEIKRLEKRVKMLEDAKLLRLHNEGVKRL